MDPALSGFALGLLLAAAKVGAVGTIAFGIAWWRARTKLRRLEASLPDPASLAERLANLEQAADYSASRLDRLIESQDALTRQLTAPPAKTSLPGAPRGHRGDSRALVVVVKRNGRWQQVVSQLTPIAGK